jgi:hypothetical protein
MFTFTIYRPDGGKSLFENVDRVEYINHGLVEVLTGNDILTHRYHTNCDLHLYTADTSFAISKDVISIIEVKKEN